MNRKPVIKHIPDFEGRTIVISDLHGNDTAFKKLLDLCGYVPGKDRLILLGDLVEKGTENLKLLHRIMDLCNEPEVYALMGNCDFVAKNVLYSYRLEFLRSVLLAREGSLLHEMADELGMNRVDKETDMDQFAAALRRHYLEELSFLNDLPHVLISPTKIFAHAGIEDEATIATDFREVMTRYHFGEEDHLFSKQVIVGHMPVSEYCHQKADFNPRFDYEKNIVSIDGGNVVKKAGQLNALLLYPSFAQTRSIDLLEEVRVKQSVNPKNFTPFYLTWGEGELELIEQGSENSLVYSKPLRRRFYIDNSFYKDGKGANYTNYEMPLRAGETVKLVNVYGKKAQIKKNGILGICPVDVLELSESQKAALVDLS